MSDITQVVFQDEVASSLLTAPIVGDHREGPIADLAEGSESEPFEPVEPGGGDLLADLETDRSYQQAEQGSAQEQQFAPEAQAEQAPTVEQGLQSLDQTIAEYGLRNPDLARHSAEELYAEFGVPAHGSVNYDAWDKVESRSSLSARQVYEQAQGDPSRVPPASQEIIKQYATDFLRAHFPSGTDTRGMSAANPQLLHQTMFQAKWNAYDAYRRGITDPRQANDPDVAVPAVVNFLRSLGLPEAQIAQNFPPDKCMRIADVWMRREWEQQAYIDQRAQQQGQTAPRASRSSRRGSNQRQRFTQNNDIFDEETMSQWDLEHSVGKRSASSNEFAAKPKAQRSRFQTNQDIFSEEVLSEMYNRL